jgi:hypothetical protein
MTSGILMNIPADLYEAATVDGANKGKMFWKITLPYIIFVTMPYLTSSFIGNINSFNTIFLLTGGSPEVAGYKAGGTDLLVTWLYKLTIDSGQYNTGAVIGILTFIITATITLISYMKDAQAFNPMDLIDNYFQTEAMKNGKAVKGFETVDFQMNVLYGAPLDKQVNDLMCMVDHFDVANEMVKSITTAYFSQNLKQIEDAMEEESNLDCGTSEEDEDILINNRNRNWVELMPDMMAEQPTLFVVGAGHLCGEKGMLKLLEKAGYTIEGMKE